MYKEQYGGSTIKLLLGVVLLVIIITIGVQHLSTEVSNGILEDINTNLLCIQAKAKIIAEKNHINKEENPLKGEKIENSEIGTQMGIEDITSYYKWNEELLREIGLNEIPIEENAFYAVNYETEEVIYSAGYKTKDGITYYKLSDIKKLLEE
jgi:ABC-type lipoprotein release transport system permease subunit